MQRIDRYDVLALVREEGPLSVYLARDTNFGCDVSLETVALGETAAIAELRETARARKKSDETLDVHAFEDLEQALFCVATRKRAVTRPAGLIAPHNFQTVPRVTPFLLAFVALLACGVAVGGAVFMTRRQAAAREVATSAPSASEGVEITWEGCPPTTITLDGGCIDREPMLLTDCASDCAESASTCEKGESGALYACASEKDAATACSRQGGSVPTEVQWSHGKASGMQVEPNVAEWASDASTAAKPTKPARAFRCFHPSKTDASSP